MLQLKFNPGLTLTAFRTTRPRLFIVKGYLHALTLASNLMLFLQIAAVCRFCLVWFLSFISF